MARMRYVVTGGTGFIGRRVVSKLLARPDAEVWVLVRRESLGRFERLAQTVASLGRAGEAACRRPHRTRPRAHRGCSRRTGHRRSRRALRRDLRHHRRRGGTARRQCGGHARGDRPGAAAGRDVASRVVDRGRGHVPGRVHRGRLRRRPGPADAVSPDEVRGRAAGALGAGTAIPGLPARGRRRRLAHRRNGQGRRARTTSSACSPSWPGCPGSPRWCCPTPVAPTSCPSTSWSKRSSHSCTPRAATDRPSTSPHRKPLGCGAFTAVSPRPPVCRPCAGRCRAAPRRRSCEATGRAKVLRNMAATQLGIPAEILDVVDLFPTFTSDNTDRRVARHRDRGSGLRVPMRRGCGGTGPSISTPTAPAATIRPDRWWASTSSSPARPAGSVARRRSPSPSAARRYSRWRATPKRSTNSSPRSANAGGQAHAFTCDVTDSASVEHTVKDILGRFGHVDYLVNNAGRSIRRSVSARPTGCTTTNA